MFKFDFEIEDVDLKQEGVPFSTGKGSPKPTAAAKELLAELNLSDLLDLLPPLISYSPLSIPLSSSRKLTLARRDLFDARFQLISEGRGDTDAEQEGESTPGARKLNSASALEFLDSPSDLIPGVYEGGLKTWECSLDLVDYLDSTRDESLNGGVQGKRILEIGCGTAVPSLYLLREIFSSPPLPHDLETKETHVHVQDYNHSVLELITLPNILLTWYMSPSSESYRATENDSQSESGTPSLPDPQSPGELPITAELKAAFVSSLQAHGITIRFFSGSWDAFDIEGVGGKYDMVLTSETIYRTESLPSLIGLMRAACGCGETVPLEQRVSSQLSISAPSVSSPATYLCLVAAKVLYFGVGGGVSEFIRAVEEAANAGGGTKSGRVVTVWEHKVGVGRNVMRIKW